MQGRDDAQATVVGGRLTVSKQAKLQSFGCVTVVKGITGSISCEGTAPCKRARMIHNAFQLRRGNDGKCWLEKGQLVGGAFAPLSIKLS